MSMTDCCLSGTCAAPDEPCSPLESSLLERNRLVCPPHCPPRTTLVPNGGGCPRSRRYKVAKRVNETLQYIWRLPVDHAAYIPPPTAPPLILVTITFPHSLQLLKLSHCVHSLRGQSRLTWLVVEDSAERSPNVAALLASANSTDACASRGSSSSRTRSASRSSAPAPPAVACIIHLAVGPTRRGGYAQRNLALKYIKDQRLSGSTRFFPLLPVLPPPMLCLTLRLADCLVLSRVPNGR